MEETTEYDDDTGLDRSPVSFSATIDKQERAIRSILFAHLDNERDDGILGVIVGGVAALDDARLGRRSAHDGCTVRESRSRGETES